MIVGIVYPWLAFTVVSVVVHDQYVSSLFFFQAEDGIRDLTVTGVQTCALPICPNGPPQRNPNLPDALWFGHDRLLKDSHLRAGAGATYLVTVNSAVYFTAMDMV